MHTFVLLGAYCTIGFTVTFFCAFWWIFLDKTFGSSYNKWRFMVYWQDPVLSQANPIQCFISLAPILILSYSLVSVTWRAAVTLTLYSIASSTCPFFISRSNQALVSPIVMMSRDCALLCYMPNGQIFRHAHLRPHRENSVSVIKSFYLASTCTSQWTR